MLAILNQTQCFTAYDQVHYAVSALDSNFRDFSRNIEKTIEDISLKSIKNNPLNFAFQNLTKNSFKPLNNKMWSKSSIETLIEDLKNLNDDEETYPIYEALGRNAWERKDYEAATFWLRQGIKKGEPTCMKLLNELPELPFKEDPKTPLETILENAVTDRINKISQIKNKSNDTEITMQRLQQWQNARSRKQENMTISAIVLCTIAVSLHIYNIFQID